MAPGISLREYIRWLPDAPSEPTDTLVLTSPEGRFVDIRILRPSEDDNPDEPGGVLPTDRLDWAFAGLSSSEMQHRPDGTQVAHSTWRHWVSSRTGDAEGVVDEGDMFPEPDGRTLEKGAMVNPATGRVGEYEELWLDLEPVATATDGGAEGEGAGTRFCTVLQLHDDENRARGVVVRLGQFCQGVLRAGDHFALERWVWEVDGGWRREAKIGDLWVPCGVVLEGERMGLGGEVVHGDYVWRVVERSDF